MKSIFSLLFFIVAMPLWADDEQTLTKSDIIYEHILGQSGNTDELKVLIHKAGHLENRPYVFEISELCKGERQVVDTMSACDIAANTVRFYPEKSQVTVLVREPAAVQTNKSSDKPECSLKAKRLVFNLKGRCGSS